MKLYKWRCQECEAEVTTNINKSPECPEGCTKDCGYTGMERIYYCPFCGNELDEGFYVSDETVCEGCNLNFGGEGVTISASIEFYLSVIKRYEARKAKEKK